MTLFKSPSGFEPHSRIRSLRVKGARRRLSEPVDFWVRGLADWVRRLLESVDSFNSKVTKAKGNRLLLLLHPRLRPQPPEFLLLALFRFSSSWVSSLLVRQFRQQIEIRSRLTSLWLKGRAVSSNCLWNKTTWGHLADVCRGLLFFNASFALCVPTRPTRFSTTDATSPRPVGFPALFFALQASCAFCRSEELVYRLRGLNAFATLRERHWLWCLGPDPFSSSSWCPGSDPFKSSSWQSQSKRSLT